MTDASSRMRYGIPPGVELSWKSWANEAETAVFHHQSGQTHLLDELAAWVVKLVDTQPLLKSEIAGQIREEFGADLPDEDVERYLTDLLPRLCRIGIVKECSPCT